MWLWGPTHLPPVISFGPGQSEVLFFHLLLWGMCSTGDVSCSHVFGWRSTTGGDNLGDVVICLPSYIMSRSSKNVASGGGHCLKNTDSSSCKFFVKLDEDCYLCFFLPHYVVRNWDPCFDKLVPRCSGREVSKKSKMRNPSAFPTT